MCVCVRARVCESESEFGNGTLNHKYVVFYNLQFIVTAASLIMLLLMAVQVNVIVELNIS